jgi:RNA polymerase sigma-70 factor, ECF subfamily
MVVRSGAGMSGENAFLSGLLKASAGQDQHAFAELYRLTAPRINAVVHRLLGANVGDAVQETYIRIWHNAGSYDPDRGGAIPWMIAIARNIAIRPLAGSNGTYRVAAGSDRGDGRHRPGR